MVTGSTTMTKARAKVHARSAPLLTTWVAMFVLLFLEMRSPHDWLPQAFVPGGAYLALFLVMRAVRPRELRRTREPYAVIALVLFLGGWTPMLVWVAGAPFLLGVALLVLGIRGRDAWLWAPGLGLMAFGPLLASGNLWVSDISVLILVNGAFAYLMGAAWRAERAVLAVPVWPVGSALTSRRYALQHHPPASTYRTCEHVPL